MPTIDTPSGKYKYKTKALYPGVKLIDKEISRDNLFLLRDLFDGYGIPFLLTFGTLLGAVREHDFISHDEDIDLLIKEEYRRLFLANLHDLRNHGFELVRFDRRDLFSLMRNGEYVDFYFYRPDDRDADFWQSSGCVIGAEFLQQPEEIDFLGGRFLTHSNFMGFIEAEYGSNWATPVVWNNYGMSPLKKFLFVCKEHLKDYLPESLFKALAKRAEAKMRAKTSGNYRRYKQRQLPPKP